MIQFFCQILGYVPDTDSEIGTVTMNSPTDWLDKQIDGQQMAGMDQDYSDTFKHYQAGIQLFKHYI